MKKFLLFIALLFAFVAQAFAAVDINSATAAELDALKGIGPVKAKAIVEYREKNGPFKSVDDLTKVKGIGKATLEGLRKDVSVAGTPARAAAPQASAKNGAETKPMDRKAAEAKPASASASATLKTPASASAKASASAEDKKGKQDRKGAGKEDAKPEPKK